MNCCCKNGNTNDLKIEGDIGADPNWCKRCGCNIDIEEIPVSNSLLDQLSSWAKKYGEWIDWNEEILLPNGMKLEDEFNQTGIALTEKVREELSDAYKLQYVPSTSARFYAKN